VRGRRYAPAGQTPVAHAAGGAHQGKARWMIIDEAFNAERPNADLKHAIGSKVPARTKTKLRDAAMNHMTGLEQSPERVKAFFQDARVRYAA
jgi:hypothetical protein